MSNTVRLFVLCSLLTACSPQSLSALDAGPEPLAPASSAAEEPRTESGDPRQQTAANAATACTTAEGTPGIVDCDGACADPTWLGDGFCDDAEGGNLACEIFQMDQGDCDGTSSDTGEAGGEAEPPEDPETTEEPGPAGEETTPAPTSCTTADGEAGIPDCDGACVPAEYVGDGYCDDGTEDANLMCPEHSDDGGDCGAAGSEPDSPTQDTGAPDSDDTGTDDEPCDGSSSGDEPWWSWWF